MLDPNDSSDFPAAHSMDTTWFAVDRDGNVALFDSGEAGAVPSVVAQDQYYPGAALEAVAAAGPPTFDRQATAAVHEGTPDHVPVGRLAIVRDGHTKLLMFLDDTPEIAKKLERAEGERAPATEGIAFLWSRVDPALFESLHESGACRGCSYHHPRSGEGALFVYEHTAENWMSGPYARTSTPSKPAKSDAMPDEVLEHAVRFDGRFAEVAELQPAELWACDSWMPGWLSLDRKTVRPFAGREDDFEDVREDNLEGQDGITVEPALPAPPEAEVVKAPPARPNAPTAHVFTGPDVEPSPSEADWSDVMPKSDPATEQKADAVDAPKKPWWKFW